MKISFLKKTCQKPKQKRNCSAILQTLVCYLRTQLKVDIHEKENNYAIDFRSIKFLWHISASALDIVDQSKTPLFEGVSEKTSCFVVKSGWLIASLNFNFPYESLFIISDEKVVATACKTWQFCFQLYALQDLCCIFYLIFFFAFADKKKWWELNMFFFETLILF